MSVWTAPITWTAAAVTVAQANTEWRDHSTFLKGALDILTNSTTADTGVTMNLFIKRTNTTDAAYSASQTGDAQTRFIVDASGKLSWGTGAAVADTTLARSAVGTLRLDNVLTIYNTGTNIALAATTSGDTNYRYSVLANGTIQWGDGSAAPDTNLYRSAANMLATDDGLSFLGAAGITLGGNIIEMTERAAPAAGAGNTARIYAVDNGAGKTQLMCIFATGVAQQLAIQP